VFGLAMSYNLHFLISAFLGHFGCITVFTLGARWGWVVNATTQLLFLVNTPGTHCTGWFGPRAGLDGCRISHVHQDLIFGPSSP